MKRLPLLAIVTIVLASPQVLAQSVADQDFQARCTAPGVTRCVGFNNTTADLVQNVNLLPDELGVFRGTLDTTTKATGAGSLRFDLPPPPHAGSNIAGQWTSLSSSGAFNQTFGPNSTFHVQFRMRFSPEMFNNTWDSYWKTVIFHMGTATCAGIELTTVNFYDMDIPTMYTDCGARGLYTSLDGTQIRQNPPLLLQQGDYNCEYGQESNTTTCFHFPANEWLTFYYKVHIGDWSQANSTIEAWVAREGQGYKQFIKNINFSLKCNASPCAGQGYNNLTLSPYMTGLSTTAGRAGVTSKIWYDDLIISTQPIPAPNSGPRPNPPTAFSAN